jgi:hypothetical protein
MAAVASITETLDRMAFIYRLPRSRRPGVSAVQAVFAAKSSTWPSVAQRPRRTQSLNSDQMAELRKPNSPSA